MDKTESTVRNMLTAIEAPLYDIGVLSDRGMLPGLDGIPAAAVLDRLSLLKYRNVRGSHIPSHEQLHEMSKAAAAGVQVVIAPQLFPTPPELADRMVALADIRPGQQVLEPSAGTGRIIDAIRRNAHGYAITAVELNCNMAHRLRTIDCVDDTRQADFLECNGDLGTFDRIVMNPPFANADDIKHILHALKMLKPGGRLVAICANGPRQNDKLRPIVEARGGIWEELPSDTFIGASTSVRTVLLMLDA
jgi:protein-L-isoaspartate O-methyltransferase